MVGKTADPVFLNGPDDKLLVGDTVEIVETSTASEANSSVAADQAAFDRVNLDNGTAAQQEALKSPEGRAFETTLKPPEPVSGGFTNPFTAIDNLDPTDAAAAVKLVTDLKSQGTLGAIANNTPLINKLVTATGLESRLKDISSNFKLSDLMPDIKLDMLSNMDWSSSFSSEGMSSLFDSMSSLWPDVDFGSFTDAIGLEAIKESSLMQALSSGADWLTDDVMGGILDKAGSGLSGLSDNFLTNALSNLSSEKKMSFAKLLIRRLSPEALAKYSEDLVPDILARYPWGYRDTYGGDTKKAYDALVADLARIEPQWWLVRSNGRMINNLEYYYAASSAALRVLAYSEPHATNVHLVQTYHRQGIPVTRVNGIYVPPPVETIV